MNEIELSKPESDMESDWGSRNHVHTLVLMAITVIGIYLCYLMALPFRSPLAWALALAVLFAPVHGWLMFHWKHPNLVTFFSVVMIGLIVVVPASFVAQRLLLQATDGAQAIEVKVTSGEWSRALKSHPRISPMVEQLERNLDLPGTIQASTAWISKTAGSFLKGSAYQVIEFCLTFYLLFYFLRDRRITLHALRKISPLTRAEMGDVFLRVGDTVHATIYGTLAVSFVQGALGGIMFLILGIPSPLLWGIVMALLSIVPVLGSFVVWLPAAIFLAMDGSWGKAIILMIWGVFVIGVIDNLLRPILVGNRLKLHPLLAFISVVGGLLLFGPAGLILGPVALTITIVLLEVWSSRGNVET